MASEMPVEDVVSECLFLPVVQAAPAPVVAGGICFVPPVCITLSVGVVSGAQVVDGQSVPFLVCLSFSIDIPKVRLDLVH